MSEQDFKIHKMGDTRIVSHTFPPGFHSIGDGFIEVANTTTMQVKEVLRYKYASLKEDPEWQIVGLAGPDKPERTPAPMDLVPLPAPWYSRLWHWVFRRPRIPTARTLSR